MPSAEQLPSGRWRGLANHPGVSERRSGRRKREPGPRTFTTREEALAWAQGRERELDALWRQHGAPVTRVERASNRHTVASLSEHVISLASLGPETKRTYRKAAGDLCRFMGELRIGEVTTEDCEKYLADMQERGLSGHTLRRNWRLLRRIMNYAVKADPPLRDKSPTRHITLPHFEDDERGRWVSDQQMLMVSYFLPRLMAAMPVVSYDTGMRWGEVAALRMDRLHLGRNPTVTVTATLARDRSVQPFTKGRKPRTVPLRARTVQAIEDHLAHHGPGPDGLVFTNSRRTPWKHSWFVEKWGAARLRADLPQVRFHDLRHSFISALANDRRVPLLRVQRLAGHSSIVTTERYMHVQSDEQADDLIRSALDGRDGCDG